LLKHKDKNKHSQVRSCSLISKFKYSERYWAFSNFPFQTILLLITPASLQPSRLQTEQKSPACAPQNIKGEEEVPPGGDVIPPLSEPCFPQPTPSQTAFTLENPTPGYGLGREREEGE